MSTQHTSTPDISSVDDSIYSWKKRLLGFFITLSIYALYYPATHYTAQLPTVDVAFDLDYQIPLIPSFMFIYAMIYPIAIFPLFLIASRVVFKRVIVAYCVLEILTLLCFLIFPVHMHTRPAMSEIQIHSFWQWCLCLCYHLDLPTCCFPSLHVSTSILSALCCWHVRRFWGYFIGTIAFLISLSTLFVKQHFIADVLLGGSLAYLVYYIFLVRANYVDFSPRSSAIVSFHYRLIPLSLFSILVISCYFAYCNQYYPWL